MNEEERRKRLKEIEEINKEQRKLKSKRDLFYKLKNDSTVKLYLKLEKELKEQEILKTDDIKKQQMRKPIEPSECSHDIWYQQEEDGKIIYKCLDCLLEIEVKEEEREKFLSENCVISSSKTFTKCRNTYCSLLCTSHVDTAYQKLLKKI